MARQRKSPQELGYNIPVKRRIGDGRYVIAYAKTLDPDKNGNIRVRTPKGTNTTWTAENTIHEPQGFKRKEINNVDA